MLNSHFGTIHVWHNINISELGLPIFETHLLTDQLMTLLSFSGLGGRHMF
jgi:hypothetical protein